MKHIRIAIVGCGGTGGNLIARLARFLTDYDNRAEVSVTLIDEDTVEMKNISRQVFDYEDIGKNKAVALASNLEACFGVKFKAYTKYILEEKQLGYVFNNMLPNMYSENNEIFVLISCVDNHAARKVFHDWFYHRSRNMSGQMFLIDSANEATTGEIVCAKSTYYKVVAPDRFHYYPDMINDLGKAVNEMSCEELNQVAPQHFATNLMAADSIFNYLCILLMNPEKAEYLRGGICYFDSNEMYSRMYKYTEKEEDIYIPETKNYAWYCEAKKNSSFYWGELKNNFRGLIYSLTHKNIGAVAHE